MKLTRRQLPGIGAAALLLKTAAAQTPASPASPDWYRQALDSKRAAGAELSRFELTLPDFAATEPAFHFKA